MSESAIQHTDARLSPEEEDRFWSRMLPPNENGCRIWTEGKDSDGYGQIRLHGTTYRAARLAYILSIGPIPAGLFVRHTCDVPACCSPAHLSLGTHTDNMRDKMTRGRHTPTSGELSGSAKLTNEVVIQIRQRSASGEKQRNLAVYFGVSNGTINDIVKRRTWTHIPD